MSDSCAARCGRPTDDSGSVCRSCAERLHAALSTVEELDDELRIATTRRARLGDVVAVSTTGPPPLPYNTASSEATQVLRDTLQAWVHEVSQHTGHACPSDSLPELARWLQARINTCRAHPDAAALLDEITHAITYAWRVIDKPAGKIYLGECGGGDNGQCQQDLYARADPSRPGRLDPRQGVVRCPTCGTQWHPDRRREWLVAQVRGSLATARDIAAAALVIAGTQISIKTVRSWAGRGMITTYPPHPKGGPVRHEVGEVLDRATRRATRRA